MIKSAALVTVAAALLVGCGEKPPEVAGKGGEDFENALARICQTQTIYKNEATCRAEETKAMRDLESIGAIPKEIADRCTAPPNIDRYSTVLSCVRAAMPSKEAVTVTEEPLLSREAAGRALSEYIGDLQPKFMSWDYMRQVYLSKLQQDIQWGSLDKFREDAEAFKAAAQKLQMDVTGMARELNLSDEDARVFDALSSAVDDVAAAELMLAVDVSVFAHTGMRNAAEENKDINDAKKARKAYVAAALGAYKHFGYPKDKVNMTTLQPKVASK